MTIHTFYADPAVGGSGASYTDDANATTGLASNGHRARLLTMFTDVVTIAGWLVAWVNARIGDITGYVGNAQTYANNAAASATAALNAPGTLASSVTSCTLATQTKTFVLNAAGKAYGLGQRLLFTSAANINNQMSGLISVAPGAGSNVTVVIDWVNPAAPNPGTAFTDWQISLGATAGVQTVAGLQGNISAAGLKTALAIQTADLTDIAAYTAAQNAKAIAFAAAL